ncbi:dihydrolipoyl dehydrogenase [Enterobacteriaceae endosymbiont of Plateumaris consimilis]|uniref:dihydrolipoyl dehydrogenase n=1 Tax=Enterobacteriaceae endosymbiont of Plateumaris consimilis TaxID=2675794 RepID=UPI0014497ED1|nr:dihydrolipoyl dehydrogenase [Enterobacteriaceae endosymbiont of Plateumaris consimilis]QJC28624.1 dihydrolipoyl dehydrogenase [Enterobacteriaceae endosymbiont of Plateumaris consimilis]
MSIKIKTSVVVIGGGPSGYSAAFRCSDLGMKTIIVENYLSLGGVCLNVGCIPSKTLLHIAKLIKENNNFFSKGILNNVPNVNIEKIILWKDQIIKKLSNGLNFLARSRKINIINGIGKFKTPNILDVKNDNDHYQIEFKHAIIATGSKPIKLPFIPYNDNRIWTSTDALLLKQIPKKILILGGGIIGLEMATIYHSLGTEINIIEMSNEILPSVDNDIMQIYNNNIKNKFNIMLNTKVVSIDNKKNLLQVYMTDDNNKSIFSKKYDIILTAIGRKPNSNIINNNSFNIKINNNGFIEVDNQMRTNISHIYAIGDVIGYPMLAHKGIHEGHLVAEIISGKNHFFIPKVIPSIAYTDPEIGWVGITEKDAKIKNINYGVSSLPWNTLGRGLCSNAENGLTKLIFNKNTNKIIGGSVIGYNAGELLGEISLAIEMGCDAEDISLTIHAHPTFYESIGITTEIFLGLATDILNK